jgi:hypothetical protein
MALIPVNLRQVASVVTQLEMRERPRPAPVMTSPLRLVRWKNPAVERYRLLFRRVGEPWLRFSRLVMTDVELGTILSDDRVEIYAVTDPQGIEVGHLELDFRPDGHCRIAFLGLIPPLIGRGFGKWLLTQAKILGWRKSVSRMSATTCSLDHANALAAYCKAGFVPVGRTIETFDDPRLSGILLRDAAPHVPMLE